MTTIGKESCPGNLQWSAFGACYPDTVCSSVLEWEDGKNPGSLCDADDDFRPKDIPCPFCDWEGFSEYLGVGEDKAWAWADRTPAPAGTEIHFHDGTALSWSATHPERGEEKVLLIALLEEEPS